MCELGYAQTAFGDRTNTYKVEAMEADNCILSLCKRLNGLSGEYTNNDTLTTCIDTVVVQKKITRKNQ